MHYSTLNMEEQLFQFRQAILAEKTAIFQAIYQQVAFSPTGIMSPIQRFRMLESLW